MSHYTELKTEMASAMHIADALRDLGHGAVEVHADAQPLDGWLEQGRSANVIIRKQHLPGCNADIGFVRNARGTFDLLVDAMEQDRFGEKWQRELVQRYAYHVARDMLAQQDFSVVEEKRERDGTIRMTLRRMG